VSLRAILVDCRGGPLDRLRDIDLIYAFGEYTALAETPE
jgi:hypothetical protein